MRIGVIADVHVAPHRRMGGPFEGLINRRAAECLATLKAASDRAWESSCDLMIVAGDLFDTYSPSVPVLAAVQKIIADSGMKWILDVGNHDRHSDVEGDHALGAFPGVQVIERPTTIFLPETSIAIVPAGHAVQRDVFDQLDNPSHGTTRVCVFHAGVKDTDTVPWLRENKRAVDAKELLAKLEATDTAVAFAGDWHDRRVWQGEKSSIVQLGALVPTGFDNHGISGYGTLAVFDTETKKTTLFTIPGPRFLKLPRGGSGAGAHMRTIALAAREQKIVTSLYISKVTDPTKLEERRAALDALIAEKLVTDGEILPDETDVEEAAKEAASVAKSAESLEAAIDGYVRAMSLDEKVSREEVASTVREYLGATGRSEAVA